MYSKACLNECIALVSSALVLLKETRQLFLLICYLDFKREQQKHDTI